MTSPWSQRSAGYATSTTHLHGPCLTKLIALARPGPDDVCLDIGTGAGHTAARLARHARKVYGLDPAEGMLRAARERYGGLSNLAFVSGYGHATGFADDTFDLVTARHTLHHHDSVSAFLEETARILKPGGRLVIADEVTPDPQVDAWYDRLERLRDPSHQRAYLLGEWRAFLRDSPLVWVVGDTDTVLDIDVEGWLERTQLDARAQEAVYAHLRNAPPLAKTLFNIRAQAGDAVAFDMPVALILAVKERDS